MNAQQIREDVIRAEGYAEGFKAGFTAYAQRVASLLEQESKPTEPVKE